MIIIGQFAGIIISIKSLADISSLSERISDLSPAMYARISDLMPTIDAIFTSGNIYMIISIIFSILILVFIFSRNILFRLLFVIDTLAGLVYSLILMTCVNNLVNDLGLVNMGYSSGIPGMTGSIIGSIIGAVIWISYVYRSKRIKNTFIYPKLYPHPGYAYHNY